MKGRISLLGFLLLALAACKGGGAKSGGAAPAGSKYPGTEEGLRSMLTDMRKSDAEAMAMTKALRPTSADYQAVFVGEHAEKLEKAYDLLWNNTKAKIGASPENSEIKIWKTTSDDMKAWTGDAKEGWPGGYQKVGEWLKPGVTWWRWKYTKPGEELGMAFDGLVFVNGHWAWFPRPWRALEEQQAPAVPLK
jgi:hypothetical protein